MEALSHTFLSIVSVLEQHPGAAEINKILQRVASVDQEAEKSMHDALKKTWDALGEGALPDSDAVAEALKATPSPLTQMFLEAPLPSEADVLAACAPNGAKPQAAKSVVAFFLQMLFGQPLGPVDEKIMDHLTFVESSTLEAPLMGFKIEFHFGPGAKKFFRNDVLTVTVLSKRGSTQGHCRFSEMVLQVIGTKIEWTPAEANPTIMRIAIPPTVSSKRDRASVGKKKKPEFIEIKQDSIFRIFENIDMEEEAPPPESPDDEMEADMEAARKARVLDGLILFHQFTAGSPILSLKRLAPQEDDGPMDVEPDGMGGSEDEMVDGDFGSEDDDSEEDDAPERKSSRKDKGKPPTAPASGKQQPECKHQ